MWVDGFFDGLGEAIGYVIRFVVDVLSGLFGGLGSATESFFSGLARAIGMELSLITLVLLVMGLALLYSGIRRLLRGAWITGILALLFGLMVMGWLIH